MNLETPDVRYARSGDVSIAYQVVGEGPVDLLFVPFMVNLVWAWEQPIFVDFCRRAASFSRLILFDKRGTGLSDRPREMPTLETRMDDIRAVMDDAGSERSALLGAGSPGGQLCALYAATYPERVAALILHNTWPRVVAAPDYPFGQPLEEWHRRVREARVNWGTREYQLGELQRYLPSFVDDPEFVQWHVNHERLAASPGAAAWFMRVLMETDIREVLPAISVPTLMLYHERFRDGCAYMAERIPNAEMVELTLPDVSTWTDPGVLDHLQRFLAEGRVDAAPERVLTTVLFTDIVDSTARAAEMGDERWRQLLQAHHATVRAQLARYGGKEVRSTGDGVFATFDGTRARDRLRRSHHFRGSRARARHPGGRPHGRGRAGRRQGGGHRGAHRRAYRGGSRPVRTARVGHREGSRSRLEHRIRGPRRARRSRVCRASGSCSRLDSATAPD